MTTWLITGANSGFGRLMTEKLLARGDTVAAFARRPETLSGIADDHQNLSLHAMDLTDEASIDRAVAEAFERHARIDVVVSNAGYGTFGAIEELTTAQIRRQIETNLIGTILFIRAVIGRLRLQGGGRVLQVTSEGGQTTYPGFATYHASKWGQEGFIESVRAEVAPFGIEMCLVEPGPAGTNFLAGVDMGEPLAEYENTPVANLRGDLSTGGFKVIMGDPTKMASEMIALGDTNDLPLRLPLGSVAWENIRRKLDAQSELLNTHRDIAYRSDLSGAK